jgi:hypothetical protein
VNHENMSNRLIHLGRSSGFDEQSLQTEQGITKSYSFNLFKRCRQRKNTDMLFAAYGGTGILMPSCMCALTPLI